MSCKKRLSVASDTVLGVNISGIQTHTLKTIWINDCANGCYRARAWNSQINLNVWTEGNILLDFEALKTRISASNLQFETIPYHIPLKLFIHLFISEELWLREAIWRILVGRSAEL